MATRKEPEIVARRVWRMTADSPMGEYLELVPKEKPAEAPASHPPKRTFHPETPPAYRAVSTGSLTLEEKSSTPPVPASRRPVAPQAASTLKETTPEPAPPSLPKLKILRPAQAESWQASSFDLLTGCVVRDVTETIPGKVFDELFAHRAIGFRNPDPRRRR
jgi:hypothetical protein